MQEPEDPYYNRRMRGTRVYALRHRIVLGVMAAGGLIGVAFHFLPASQTVSKAFLDLSMKESQFVQERRLLLSNTFMSSSEKIKKDIEESEKKCM